MFCIVRINNDLLLWEPTAPSPVETVESMPYGGGLSVASQLISTYSKDTFSQFRSLGPEGELHFSQMVLYNFYQRRAYYLCLSIKCDATLWCLESKFVNFTVYYGEFCGFCLMYILNL